MTQATRLLSTMWKIGTACSFFSCDPVLDAVVMWGVSRRIRAFSLSPNPSMCLSLCFSLFHINTYFMAKDSGKVNIRKQNLFSTIDVIAKSLRK